MQPSDQDATRDERPGARREISFEGGDGGLPLVPGSRLGRYTIRGLLGAGGMGHVYLGHDSTLDREVAIKALAHAFHHDQDRLRRFEREARTLAALNHPNIADIYDLEELDGAVYLVLEKVDGTDLAQRIAAGPLTPSEALDIAAQVADGLAEAHAKGVIHRDLKPSNVMLSASGKVKLVDFGLAKSIRTGSDVASNLTATAGLVIGTAPYMSPEQVRGEEVDERVDVWAFGCLLFEMMTGRPAFARSSVAEIQAAVLRDDPEFAKLAEVAPPQVLWLVRRCLNRDRNARPRHIADLGLELLITETVRSAARTQTMLPMRERAGPRFAIIATAITAVVAAAALLLLRPTSDAHRPTALALALELPRELTLGNRLSAPYAFAPDGSALVVEASAGGTTRLYLRRLDAPSMTALPGTEGAWQPFLSPDGAWLGFFGDRKLAKVPLAGGSPVVIGEFGNNPRGATWLADGSIVLSPLQTSGLVRVDATNGRTTPLTVLDEQRGEATHRWPEALPGGRGVLFTVGFEGRSFEDARIDVVALDTRQRHTVMARGSYARYAPGGQLLFVRNGRLYAVDFDLDKLAVRGEPEVVVDGVRHDLRNGAAHVAVSSSGALLYAPGPATSDESYLTWLRRDGKLERIVDAPRSFHEPRLAPDGDRVAVVVTTGNESDVRLFDARGTATRLSFDLPPHRPTWTRDGRTVTVSAERDGKWGLYDLADDGGDGGKRRAPFFEQAVRTYPCDWTPDGRQLVFQQRMPDHGWDLYVLEVDETHRPLGAPRAIAATPFQESNAVVSPDGRWLAYESDELDGVFEIYLRAWPQGDRKTRISTGGARWPSWSDDGMLGFWETSPTELRVLQIEERDGHPVVTHSEKPFPEGAFAAPPLSSLALTAYLGRLNMQPAGGGFLVLESSSPPADSTFTSPVLLSDWTLRRGARATERP